MMTFSAGLLALAATIPAALVRGDLVTVNNPSAITDANNTAGTAIVAAAGRMPDLTAVRHFDNSWTGLSRDAMWDWRINITNITVPNTIQDLGKPNADYSQNKSVVNTQWQLNWPGVDRGDNYTLEEYLYRTYGEEAYMFVGAYHIYLPDNVISQYKSPNPDFNCSTILNATCIAGITSAAAAQQSINIAAIDGCMNVGSLVQTGATAVPIKASDANVTVDQFHPNNTFYSVISPEVMGGSDRELIRAAAALNILTLALHRPDNGAARSDAKVVCQVVGLEDGLAFAGAGVRLSAAASVAVLAFLGSLAFISL